jgi:uncharacterized membrane protein YfhO
VTTSGLQCLLRKSNDDVMGSVIHYYHASLFISLIDFNINNQLRGNQSPHYPMHHIMQLILTFFILQTYNMSKGTSRAEPLGEIQIKYITTIITSFIIVEESLMN